MSEAAQRYWDDNAEAPHTFVHPVESAWLADLPTNARILDYGCGHGRLTAELAAAGWRAVGVDFAAGMIARGRREHPGLDLRHVERLPLDEPDVAFDAALLFAVLTCIPADEVQQAVVAELRRLVRPGGLVYVSDYLLQPGERYAARYEAGFARHGVLGVWDREDGGVFRHHTLERLDELLAGFEPVGERSVETKTLSGASAVATQRLVRRL